MFAARSAMRSPLHGLCWRYTDFALSIPLLLHCCLQNRPFLHCNDNVETVETVVPKLAASITLLIVGIVSVTIAK